MFGRIRSLFRVTAVRLSIIYTLIFGLVAVGLVAYMTGATVNVLRQQYEESIDEEVQGLAQIYRNRGLRRLIATLERRARAPGANLYVVTNPSGEILGGNVPRLESRVMSRIGWTRRPFKYQRYGDGPEDDHRAIARIIEVPNGLRILVGRDIGETEGFRRVVGRSLALALGTMVGLGLLTWFIFGRRALRRIDEVSQSSVRIMGGDRSERLPISGSGDEFDRLSENLNSMLDRINSLDEGLKQMSDNIAHDLKTPITRLRNKADEALAMDGDKAAREELITDIIGDCDQIVRTFDALLMISRVESGSKVATMQEMDLVLLLQDVHELYEAVAEDAGVSFRLDLGSLTEANIDGNRELLSQALSNLIDNALKYGRTSDDADGALPCIEIALEVVGEEFVLSVIDNGDGIHPEDYERVTERFVRLDKSRSKSGNGLGLSLVAAIVELHGGKLRFSDANPGLKISLLLPKTSKGRNA
ncbi:MAG: HAMP domain-containing sensor histidine kinase [Rhizobiaceae bacterium]|nr:HAMP domain-containing sensor histidine kinase [Rhizobiaceae bacterium]